MTIDYENPSEDYEAGHEVGYDSGHELGYNEGYVEGRKDLVFGVLEKIGKGYITIALGALGAIGALWIADMVGMF